MTAIRLIRHGSPLTRSWVPPTVIVDGRMYPVNDDDALIPVLPGVRTISVSENLPAPSKWASMAVSVAPGQVVTVYFSPPAVPYASGTLGFAAQTHSSWTWMYVILGVLALVLIVPVIVILAVMYMSLVATG
ncbi:hypothetical protein ACXYTP_10690 [Tsukamurella ocularis]|uniref:hypothetical protein n=1 Tax=Tsukamurella ocularis TaxID=1970234 RepID=UPI0039EFA137